MLRYRASLRNRTAATVRNSEMVTMPIDLSRETFKLVSAPRSQRCACKCGQTISPGQLVYARPQTGRGHGTTRIIDLEDHYRSWLENTAREYAARMAAVDKNFAQYLR